MTLDDIKKHPLFPFVKFQTDDAAFLMLELFWTQLAQEALGPDLAATAVPLMEADQKDGNPILFFRLPNPARAIRVVLTFNDDDLPMPQNRTPENPYVYHRPIEFFPDKAPLSFDRYPPETVDAMLIFCDMNAPDVFPIVTAMMRDFFIEGLAMSDIEARADQYCKQIGYPDPIEEKAYWAMHPVPDEGDVENGN
jgi:hypothetical protein